MSEEQSKISRNLHDGVAQDLAALKLYLEKEDISKSKFYAQQAFNEVRYMIGTTHLNLNESFEEIVKKLAATLEANYNISTKVYIGSTKIQHLSENVQIELIRILQEALSNISRHANASNVEIRFVDGIDDFRFIIKDDGKGFSEEEVELKNKQSAKKHYGVSNIKERVELLGGTVNFISEGGTTIAITIKDSVR
jgi:signal transduction histidine kinase